MTYANIVDEIQKLSLEDKKELEEMIHKMRIEERREEIYKNGEKSLKEYKSDKLKGSSSVNDLMADLNG